MKSCVWMILFSVILGAFAPVSALYAETCQQQTYNAGVSRNVSDICAVVVRSEVCQNVPADKLINCRRPNQSVAANIWDYITRCAGGVLDSVSEMVSFLWDVMKWFWDNATSSRARSRTSAAASEHINSALLYLNTEYERAYARSSSPFRTMKAVRRMGAAIGRLIFNSIEQMVQSEVEEFQCLNGPAKGEMICSLVATFFIPPAAVIGLIKYGPRALRMFPNLRRGMTEAQTSMNRMTRQTRPRTRPTPRPTPRPRAEPTPWPRRTYASTMDGRGPNMMEIAQIGRYTRTVAATLDDQVAYLMREIPEMNAEQARILIQAAHQRGSSVVFGGSRVRGNYRPGSDLDVGFGSLSNAQASKILDRASRIDDGLPIERTRIVPGNRTDVIDEIASPEEFFQRRGIRGDRDLRAGEEYLPSGSISIFPDGTIIRLYPN